MLTHPAPKRGAGWMAGLVLASVIFLARPAAAQQPSVAEAFRGELRRAAAMSVSRPAGASWQEERRVDIAIGRAEDHRWEGAAIGAVLGAVGLTIVGLQVCEEDCGVAAVRAIVLGGALGGFVGLLVGGAIPKERPATAQEEP